MYRRSITLTANDRVSLFRSTLTDLAANDLEGWRIHVRIEPGPHAAELAETASQILRGRDLRIAVNAMRLGVRDNPKRVIADAFAEGSDLNLHLEDDFRLAPDATALADWYLRNHRPHWLVLSLLAGLSGTSGFLSNPDWPDVLFEARTFNSIGFAVRREEWESHLAPAWPTADGVSKSYANLREWGWDFALMAMLAEASGMRSVQPVLARASHAGVVGTYSTPATHYPAFTGLELNAVRGAAYRIAATGELPHTVRAHAAIQEEYVDLLMLLEKAMQKAERRTLRGRLRKLRGLVSR